MFYSMDSNSRPLGVTLLSLLCAFGGSCGLVVSIGLIPKIDDTGRELLNEYGVPVPVFMVYMIAMMLAGAAGGVGMWLGRAWGWWLATGYTVYAVLRAANALVQVWLLSSTPEFADMDPGRHYAKFIGRVIINGLIVLYLFRWKRSTTLG